jgi:hypothetical protein
MNHIGHEIFAEAESRELIADSVEKLWLSPMLLMVWFLIPKLR